MGMLFNLATEERVLLRANHVFGRSETRADTCILDADVSFMHAVMRFRDGVWSIADFSRNGTSVDGEALRPGRWLALKEGQQVRFGCGRRSVWQVHDLSPPGTSLLPLDPQRPPLILMGSQLLPHPESPEIAIFQDASGDWLLDRDGEIRVLAGGDAVTFSGVTYRLMLSERLDETAEAAGSLASAPQLSFVVSADEEHVRLRLVQGSRTVDLGERSHHYCLLTLARRRLEDARSGLSASEQGWCECEELAGMLRVSATTLNIQIYRARQQLMSSVPGAARLASIVERRRGSLRLGELPFEVTRDLCTEGRYRPSALGSHQEALT
jgi:hypothetical protein